MKLRMLFYFDNFFVIFFDFLILRMFDRMTLTTRTTPWDALKSESLCINLITIIYSTELELLSRDT